MVNEDVRSLLVALVLDCVLAGTRRGCSNAPAVLIFTEKFAGTLGILGVLQLVAVGGAFVVPGRWLRQREQQTLQALADVRATRVGDAMLRGEDLGQPFSLYLRPFYITGKIQSDNPNYSAAGLSVAHFSEPRKLDFEYVLSNAVKTRIGFVALGAPGEHIGAGRILTDEAKWQNSVAALAKGAALLLLVPSDRPGTRWEINLIRDNRYWDKTICLMPPSEDEVIRHRGHQTRETLFKDGITLPAHESEGLVARFGNDGSCEIVDKSFTPTAFADALKSTTLPTKRPRKRPLWRALKDDPTGALRVAAGPLLGVALAVVGVGAPRQVLEHDRGPSAAANGTAPNAAGAVMEIYADGHPFRFPMPTGFTRTVAGAAEEAIRENGGEVLQSFSGRSEGVSLRLSCYRIPEPTSHETFQDSRAADMNPANLRAFYAAALPEARILEFVPIADRERHYGYAHRMQFAIGSRRIRRTQFSASFRLHGRQYFVTATFDPNPPAIDGMVDFAERLVADIVYLNGLAE